MDNPTSPVIFGEVLFDYFPDGSCVLGGAPFNVAWHLQAFGLSPLLISRIGDDPEGHRIAAAMSSWGMDLSGLQTDPEYATGAVDVTIEQGEPRFEILFERAYDHIRADFPPLPAQGILYHGSLALRHPDSRAVLHDLKRRMALPVFVDVNLRAPWSRPEVVEAAMAGARWLKVNEDELARLEPGTETLEQRAAALLRRLSLEWLLVTRGAAGACLLTAQDEIHRVAPEKHLPMVDTVGAGDAFAGVMVYAHFKQWPVATALQRAQQFAGAIVGIRGATPETLDFYEPFLQAWN